MVYKAFEVELGDEAGLTIRSELRSVFVDHPDGVDDPRYVAKNCQQDVDPEVLPDTYLQEHP